MDQNWSCVRKDNPALCQQERSPGALDGEHSNQDIQKSSLEPCVTLKITSHWEGGSPQKEYPHVIYLNIASHLHVDSQACFSNCNSSEAVASLSLTIVVTKKTHHPGLVHSSMGTAASSSVFSCLTTPQTSHRTLFLSPLSDFLNRMAQLGDSADQGVEHVYDSG